jgi:hypothetical protein
MCCSTAKFFVGLVVLIFAASHSFAAQPQAITLNSHLVAYARPLAPPAGTPAAFATVFLIAGGNGVLQLDGNGDVQKLDGNFLIRSGYRFLASGLNVAMIDANPDFPDPAGFGSGRSTQSHADLLAKATEVISSKLPSAPIWVVGTSNGTISVANLAARFSSSKLFKGIVLTSSVTQPASTPGASVLSLNPGLSSIKAPSLVVWHQGDNCPGSPNGSAHAVFAGLASVTAMNKAEVVITKGNWAAMPACSAFGYHGFSGDEGEVVTAIAKFIAAHP